MNEEEKELILAQDKAQDKAQDEKKSIEILKERKRDLLGLTKSSFYSCDRKLYKERVEAIDTILNLIKKQQKEIEGLNKENTRQQELIGNIHQKWKDKIKEKMRGEINKSWRNTEQRKCQLYAYDILKELLGETND